MGYVVAAVLGYLLGSIPVALWVARRHGVDLRQTGDGNPGAWNALEQLGGRLVAGVAGLSLAGWWGGFAGVLGAMLGHAFPVFAGFRGGKAVMTFVGGALALSPWAAAVCLALCLATTLVFSFKWGARAGVFAFPLVQLATDPIAHVAATGVLMSLIGLLFLLDTSGRARPAPAAPPPS